MPTVQVNVEEALLERIIHAAQARGEDTEQVIVDVLKQVFRSKKTEDSVPLDTEMLAVLAPFWAEQDREEAGREIPDSHFYAYRLADNTAFEVLPR